MKKKDRERQDKLFDELNWWLETCSKADRVWERSKIGKAIKEALKSQGHWKNLSRGNTQKK